MAPRQTYECNHCKEMFTNKLKLQTHMRIHANEMKRDAASPSPSKKPGRKKAPAKSASAGIKRVKKETVATQSTRDSEASTSNTLNVTNESEPQAVSESTSADDTAPSSSRGSSGRPSTIIIPVGNNTALLVEEVHIVPDSTLSSSVTNASSTQNKNATKTKNNVPGTRVDSDDISEKAGATDAHQGAETSAVSEVAGPSDSEVITDSTMDNNESSQLESLEKPFDIEPLPSTSSIFAPKPDTSIGSLAKETIGSLLRKGTLFAHMRGEIANRVQSFLEETNVISTKRSRSKVLAAFKTGANKNSDKGAGSKDKKVSEEEDASDGDKEAVSCIECGVEFTDKALLLQHLACHTDLKIYHCEVCNKKFTRKYHMDRHKQMTACSGQPPPAHPCQVCGKVYTRKDNLREHLRAHAGEVYRKKRYKCDFCEKEFHGTSLLKIHVRTHTGEKPFQCEFCPKSFTSGGALTKHRRVHTGEKPYECGECGIRFSLKGTLNRHLRIHTGVRPHVCRYCGKQFIQAGGLKAHLFFHTGQNGFKCELCGKTFNRKARLQMHTRYVHEKIKPFDCTDCGKRFTRKEDLYRHYVMHTGEKPFECPTCLKRFSIKPSLKLHLLTHTKEEPRSCHECGRAFIRKDCLLRHMRKRHRDLLDKIFLDEKDEKLSPASTPGIPASRVMTEQVLCESIQELLSLLVDEPTLNGFGWPDKPVDELLEAVIRRCGHTPVNPEDYSYMDRLRENAKLLFTVVIDDNAVKTLLNNQTVDEVILHVLRLAKS